MSQLRVQVLGPALKLQGGCVSFWLTSSLTWGSLFERSPNLVHGGWPQGKGAYLAFGLVYSAPSGAFALGGGSGIEVLPLRRGPPLPLCTFFSVVTVYVGFFIYVHRHGNKKKKSVLSVFSERLCANVLALWWECLVAMLPNLYRRSGKCCPLEWKQKPPYSRWWV